MQSSIWNKDYSPASGGGGTETYTNLVPTQVALGGIPSGSTFLGKTMTEMWNALLYPFLTPSFTSFAISSQASILEVGDSILANRTFSWSTSYGSNISPSSISIIDLTGGNIEIKANLTNDGIEPVIYPAITKVLPSNHSFRIKGIDLQTNEFLRDISFSWRWRTYYGESTNSILTESDIKGLRAFNLNPSYTGTFNFLSGGYKYFIWPVEYGNPTTFKDASNNLSVPIQAPYVVSVTNSFGVTCNYNVFRTVNVLGGSINIIVS
jgi:hypothetical protein